MTALTISSKDTSTPYHYGKALEGINVSKDSHIVKIWSEVYNDVSSSPSTTTSSSELANTTNAATGNAATAAKSSNACEVIRKAGDPTKLYQDKNSDTNDGGKICVPIPVLQAIAIVTEGQQQQKQQPTKSFDEILSTDKNASLCFTSPKSETSKTDNGSFQKRLQRLRLQQEETKYNKLTTNLQDQRQDDDITAKSMTYAASVGLNMVIAPLSFGCFMYFFAGGVMDYFFADDDSDNGDEDGGSSSSTRSSNNNAGGGGPTDIKRVIIGVISGVGMMFIEMILFVIRTHEFEEHSRKKKIKQHKQGKGGVRPFGAYSKDMPTDYYSTPPPPPSSSSTTTTTTKLKKSHVNKKRSEPTSEEEITKKKN